MCIELVGTRTQLGPRLVAAGVGVAIEDDVKERGAWPSASVAGAWFVGQQLEGRSVGSSAGWCDVQKGGPGSRPG
jgi:hypothetical protein